jgi:hypothetical protein
MTKLASIILLVTCASAQVKSERIQFDWERLASKAVEKVDVSLEGAMLEMASKFLGNSGDEAKAKQAIQGLQGVFVRSFTFDKEGQYSEADLLKIRDQLRGPEWSRIINLQDKQDALSIYLKTDGKQTQGIVVLAAEPKELTLVQIVGQVDLATLQGLSGQMGIPKMSVGPQQKGQPSKKNDD